MGIENINDLFVSLKLEWGRRINSSSSEVILKGELQPWKYLADYLPFEGGCNEGLSEDGKCVAWVNRKDFEIFDCSKKYATIDCIDDDIKDISYVNRHGKTKVVDFLVEAGEEDESRLTFDEAKQIMKACREQRLQKPLMSFHLVLGKAVLRREYAKLIRIALGLSDEHVVRFKFGDFYSNTRDVSVKVVIESKDLSSLRFQDLNGILGSTKVSS
jgi:hypothetical protein